METIKYVISGVIRDCLDYPSGFVECVNIFFIPEKKDLFTIELIPIRNWRFRFEVFSKEQREKVIFILEKTVYNYEEMEFCSYE
jgi:hypothetical protein